MSLEAGGRCAACGRWRWPRELLRVTSVATGATRFVCRPLRADPRCFAANVGPAAVESIRLADPSAPAPAGQSKWERRPDPPRLPGIDRGGAFLPPHPGHAQIRGGSR